LLKAFITRIFRIPHPIDCRQILGITTITQTRTDGCQEVHQRFLSSIQCQCQDWSRDEHQRWQFKLKPPLINMVQQSSFCGMASEDSNAHLQHFLEICNTFTIRGVTQDAVRLHLFLSHLVFKPKPNAHMMRAQESSLHTYHTENRYRITNVTIYSIYYRIMSLQKTKSNALGCIAAERHHNSTGNRLGAITCLEHHIEEF
jgi:hypothetical protein